MPGLTVDACVILSFDRVSHQDESDEYEFIVMKTSLLFIIIFKDCNK